MKVELVTVDQSYSLDTNTVDNFAIFKLEDGSIVRAAIDEEATLSIIKCASSSTPLNGPTIFPLEATNVEDSSLVAWAELSDSELPAGVKDILKKINAPTELSRADIEAVVASISGSAPSSGSNGGASSAPRKTVLSTQEGYPMGVLAQDPGEVSSGDLDEDGVGQL